MTVHNDCPKYISDSHYVQSLWTVIMDSHYGQSLWTVIMDSH